MAHALSSPNKTALNTIITYLTGAPEVPFDSTVAERLAPIAVSSGFAASTGAFMEAVKLNPITTLLRWVAYVG